MSRLGWLRRPLAVRLARYTAGSAVAAGVSETAFVLAYGPVGAGPRAAGVVAFVAGAIPSWGLNRRWTWRRRGRARLGREVLPYLAVVLATAGLAIALGSVVDLHVRSSGMPRPLQVSLVAAAYLLPYATVFLLKFLLFEWLVFSAPPSAPEPLRRSRPPRR
jgi:putative flippase GtrA